MSANNHQVDRNKESKDKSVENNPCGLCRVQGLPVCKGHGGGSGGSSASGASSEGTSGAKKTVIDMLKSSNPAPVADVDVDELISQNESWTRADVLESVFDFENSDALFGATLDMERGLIAFYGNKNLSEEQQLILDEFFNTLEDELSSFKNELAEKGNSSELINQIKTERKDTSLTMKFPSPIFYDAFVQRLVDKNLLPVEPASNHEKSMEALERIQSFDIEETGLDKTTAPTPFDIRNGPKPKGWGDLPA